MSATTVSAHAGILTMKPKTSFSVRHETVFVGAVGRVASRKKQRIVTEQKEKQPLKLLPENHVNDEIDATVDRHQQIAQVDHHVQIEHVFRLDFERFHNVDHHW